MQTKENKIHQEEEIMKKIIRLTESDLHRIVKESVKRILAEDGEGMGSFNIGGNSSFSVNSTAGDPKDPTGQQHNHITAPGLEVDSNDESLERNAPISNVGKQV